MIYIIPVLIFFSCGLTSPKDTDSKKENTINTTQTSEILETGWYFLTDSTKGVKRTLKGSEEIYFIKPMPIVTVQNFTDMEVYQSYSGNYGLTIRLDDKGTKLWSMATRESIGKKVALIIKNELYFTPTVNAQIDVGITALNRGDLSEGELKEIKKKIEKEKK